MAYDKAKAGKDGKSCGFGPRSKSMRSDPQEVGKAVQSDAGKSRR